MTVLVSEVSQKKPRDFGNKVLICLHLWHENYKNLFLFKNIW